MTDRFSWHLWLESLDGLTTIPLTHPDSIGQVLLQSGFQGLGVPPVDLVTGVVPGVPGGTVEDVTVLTRKVVLPLRVWGRTDDHKWQAVQALRDLTDPTRDMTRDGSFRLVCHSAAGVRELTLAYAGGLEGDFHGRAAPEAIVLDLVATDPIARERQSTVVSFPLVPGDPFLASAGAGSPWGTRRLAPSTVLGEGMRVDVNSAVPVHPVVWIVGPAPDGATIRSDSGLYLRINGRVPEGSVLRLVTDPRARSARLDDERAWSMVDRSSRLRPLDPGRNVLDVTVPGASGPTMLRLGWRGGFRSMW